MATMKRQKTGGRVAVPEAVLVERGGRVQAVRKELGLTQDQVAERGGLEGWKVSKLERGDGLSSAANRRGLARGLGLPSVEDIEACIDGDVSPKATAAKAGKMLVAMETVGVLFDVAKEIGLGIDDAHRVLRDVAAMKGEADRSQIERLLRGQVAETTVDHGDLTGSPLPKVGKPKGRRR